uniref:Connector enhancer of kinase suppressor of ras n=1 Tax=Glossina brevipalpis TaxID=37001 RepID=A0A1A9WNI7_9MUSC
MAYINVAEWSPDQVTDWLKGLDDSMYSYVYSFANNEVEGRQLLNIRPYELEQLGMLSIGHQEIVLEAVENLRNFHYNLDKENLQFMALHVATAARSLHSQLASQCGATVIETQILSDITRTIATIKPLIGWLDRSPFQGQFQFTEICRKMLRLGLEMATTAQRERFVENPVEKIRGTAKTLELLANYIIQDITDPMLLQPASLNLVTLKKRESELGFNIESTYHGIHRITDIKQNSPAHNSGKIEDGDEIVQINYQTVVGWQYKNVLLQLRESLPDVLLTLKKRPKHTKIYGQIYMQPYRLPSKKRSVGSRWGENVPSPRPGLLPAPDNAFKTPKTLNTENEKADDADTDSISSDILTPTDTKATEKESRLYYPKPRAMLQRRNTICGDELLGHKSLSGIPLWHERKTGTVCDPASPSLRDKSVSFGFGLEITPRPTTCIGISSGMKGGSSGNLFTSSEGKKLRQVIIEQPLEEQQEEHSKPGVSKVVRFDAKMNVDEYNLDEKYTCNVENTILETFEPIPFADEEEEETIETLRNVPDKADKILEAIDKVCSRDSLPLVEAVNVPVVVKRGRLDKSHSTPAYDNSCTDPDAPPAIEPRKEFLMVTPPVPPPRPRKQSEATPIPVPVPPPKPPGLLASLAAANAATNASAVTAIMMPATSIQGQTSGQTSTSTANVLPSSSTGISETENNTFLSSTSSLTIAGDNSNEINELHTPTKARTLTLKKKHSLIAKRRNVNLKILGTGDIQGHLYRRTKDKRGVTFWARLYFVMLDTILYGFRCKEAAKASCVIFLPGFTVSLAKEVHSKPNAFKVYHSAKTFYFAAESQDALSQWVDFIRQATLQKSTPTVGEGCSAVCNELNTRDLFSENDSSDEENESIINKNLCTPSPQTVKENTCSSGFSKLSISTPTTTAKHDRRYLGSLRKLTKGTLPFKSSSTNEKKVSNDIPVPTEQFRSYRKVPGGSFGIQIGANTPGYHDTTMHPFNNTSNKSPEQQNVSQKIPSPGLIVTTAISNETIAPPVSQPLARKSAISSSRSSIVSTSDAAVASSLGPPASPAPAREHTVNASSTFSDDTDNTKHVTPSRSIKKIPYNFIHASNPNLVEFGFQTSKTLDYTLPKINSNTAWDALPSNTQGFMTLKDLMLQKQEEEAQDMYNNRVLLGVEKKEEHKRNAQQQRTTKSTANGLQNTSTCAGDSKVAKTQSRSLPKPPDYEISFKPDDEDIQLTRTKEGLKLRDFGYELISGDEPIDGIASNTNNSTRLGNTRQLSNQSANSNEQNQEHANSTNWTTAMKTRQFLLTSHKHKKHSSGNSYSAADLVSNGDKRSGSFKKKGKLESFKTSSERIFQFGKHSSSSTATAPSSTGVTMTLPLNKKSSHGLLEGAMGGSNSGIKKSHTYNNDLKDKAGGKYEAQRKNSAPMPIFSKLSFSTSSSSSTHNNSNVKTGGGKEKKLLGSPLLHRTVFGHHHQHHTSNNQNFIPTTTSATTCMGREYDQEIFSQVIFPKVTTTGRKYSTASATSNITLMAPEIFAPPPPKVTNANIADMPTKINAPEYPNMECPPVFEPDIYSLTDLNASLLLRRNNNNNNNNNNNSSTNNGQQQNSGGGSANTRKDTSEEKI